MKIGIIGAGKLGGTLGKKWASTGHEIRFDVRNPQDSKFDELRGFGAVGAVGEAVAFGEVVVLALPGSGVADFAAEHAGALAGKIIIDATNNPRSAEMNSLTMLAHKAPSARLVRAFNTLGWENFSRPEIGGVQVDLFFCGHPSARADVEKLIADIGLRPVYIGDIDVSAALDGMTRLWFALAFGQGYGRRTAFKLLTEG